MDNYGRKVRIKWSLRDEYKHLDLCMKIKYVRISIRKKFISLSVIENNVH